MKTIKIALVGKISEPNNSYENVKEAVDHAASSLNVQIEILWVDSVLVNSSNVKHTLKTADGIILLGGFGESGVEGMINTAAYARENNVPILGICLGMQIMVIEFARNVLGYKEATSTEFNIETTYPVVDRIKGLKDGELREGVLSCLTDKNSLAYQIYGQEIIVECFRHGYEFNTDYKDAYINHGVRFSCHLKDSVSIEILEIPNNNFYIGVQYHPEFESSPSKPHPLFVGLLESIKKYNI